MKRLTLLGILAGALLIAVGVITIGSTVGQSEGHETRTAGMLLISFGGMIIALPLYIEARQNAETRKKAAANSNDARLRCLTCGDPNATMRCEKHKVRLCPNCISQHDEPQCFYVPLSRFRKAASSSS